MTTESRNDRLLVLCTVVLVTVLLLGSFVVSLKIENIIYLILFYVILIMHTIGMK